MLGRNDGLFRCFACLECKKFADDDASILTPMEVNPGVTLKSMAARKVIWNRKRGAQEIKLPEKVEDYLCKLDFWAGGREEGQQQEDG